MTYTFYNQSPAGRAEATRRLEPRPCPSGRRPRLGAAWVGAQAAGAVSTFVSLRRDRPAFDFKHHYSAKLAIHSVLLVTASICLMSDSPPLPLLGMALFGVSVFIFRRLDLYSYLNLAICTALLFLFLIWDPSVLVQKHSLKWIIILIAIWWWFKFSIYRSDRSDDDSSHDT